MHILQFKLRGLNLLFRFLVQRTETNLNKLKYKMGASCRCTHLLESSKREGQVAVLRGVLENNQE